MFQLKRNQFLVAVLVITALILTACPAAVPAGQAPAAAPAAEATTAPAAEAPAAATGDMPRNETLILDIDGGKVADPTLWNPLVPGNRRDQGFHQAILEPLFILNYQTGEMEPWIGESFTPNDTQDTWTLKLRQGVEWSDGQPLTADDVVFTIDMLKAHVADGLSDASNMDNWVDSVSKVDDTTVEFKLKKPNPRFELDYFAVKIWGSVNILPKHIWDGQDPVTFKNYDAEKGWPVGTGAYTLKSFNEDGTEFVYQRNDNWWGAKTGVFKLPAPKYLKWVWAGPPETRAALMADDQLDSLMDVTLGALQAIQAKNPNIIAWYNDLPKAWVPDPCSRTMEFNTAKAPWDDPEMRWAINYAIDRDQIVKVAYEGSTFKSRHFFPAYPPLDAMVDAAEKAGAWNTEQLWTYDPAKAAQIIESKGYTKNGDYYEKDGKQLSMDIITHEAFIEKQRIAQVVVEELQALGINASTRTEAGGTWDEDFRNGNFEVKMGWQTCGSVNEPWASLDNFNVSWLKPLGERADNNAWRWSGPDAEAYSKIVDEMGTLPLGDPKVQDLFNEAMKIWEKDLPVIPITQAKKIIPFDTKYWKGWPTADDDYIHPPTWWQHTHAILQHLEPTGAQ
ncbi:MAG: ABC transporter substrate-binding protein [Caldilineaceae bacterium]